MHRRTPTLHPVRPECQRAAPAAVHIGNMALAPKLGAPVITNPPMRTGGNVDNRRYKANVLCC